MANADGPGKQLLAFKTILVERRRQIVGRSLLPLPTACRTLKYPVWDPTRFPIAALPIISSEEAMLQEPAGRCH